MAGAAGMAALNRRLAKVPDDAVAELVRWFVPRSQQIGGRIRLRGRVYKLTSRIKKRRRQQSANTVILAGDPPGAWALKSYGHRGGYQVRPRNGRALRLSAVAPGAFFAHVTVNRPAQGDGRWDRLVREADRKFPDVVASLIDRKVII